MLINKKCEVDLFKWELVMKKLLFGLVLISCYGLQSAQAADEKVVHLTLSNGSGFKMSNLLA
jgi:hypothetical protein